MNKNGLKFSVCNLLFFIFVPLLVVGCAAALVPESSDPKEKINQGHQLMQMGRPIAALKLYNQSYELSSKKQDYVGMGRAQWWLANLYKGGNGQGQLKLPDQKKSIEAHGMAGELFSKANYAINASLNYWMAGAMSIDIQDKAAACNWLEKARQIYRQDSIDKNEFNQSEAILTKIKDSMANAKCDLKL